MSRVSTYLNFMGNTEDAFRFYGSVFGTQISGQIARMGDTRGPSTVGCGEELCRPHRTTDPGRARADGHRRGPFDGP